MPFEVYGLRWRGSTDGAEERRRWPSVPDRRRRKQVLYPSCDGRTLGGRIRLDTLLLN